MLTNSFCTVIEQVSHRVKCKIFYWVVHVLIFIYFCRVQCPVTVINRDLAIPSIRRESKQKLGDVMKQLAPYLKLTTEYVTNFDHARNVITEWQMKSPKFASIISSLEVCTLVTTL